MGQKKQKMTKKSKNRAFFWFVKNGTLHDQRNTKSPNKESTHSVERPFVCTAKKGATLKSAEHTQNWAHCQNLGHSWDLQSPISGHRAKPFHGKFCLIRRPISLGFWKFWWRLFKNCKMGKFWRCQKSPKLGQFCLKRPFKSQKLGLPWPD